MSDQITYDNKVDLQVATNIANINKVTASDMNEIKSVVNTNAEEVGDTTSLTTTDKTSVVNAINEINAPGKWVSVGTTAPTDGRRVWFSNGRNILPGSASQWESGHYSTTGVKETYPTRMRLIYLLPVKPSTTYYMSCATRIFIVREYNANGQFIYNAGGVYAAQPFTTQSGTYFLGITYDLTYSDYNEATAKLFMCENSVVDKSYEPYIEKSVKVDDENFISMSDLVSVGANQPSDGKRVWVKKSKNDFNKDGQLNTIATVVQGGATIVKTADKITFTTTSSNNSGFSINGANISKYIDNLDTSKNYYVSMDIKANRNINVQMGIATRPNFAVTTETQRIQTTTTINGTAGFEVWSTSQTADDTIEVTNIMISTKPDSFYEPYVENGLYVDEEEWYNPKKMDDIKTRIATRVSYLLNPTIGWKRIAKLSGMSGGTILLSNTTSYGTLGEFNFTYAGGFGNSFTKIFKIITNGHYFNKARIVQKGNSEGYLELYQQFEYSRTLTLVLSPLSQGVNLYTQETEGSIPDGYTATEYTFT